MKITTKGALLRNLTGLAAILISTSCVQTQHNSPQFPKKSGTKITNSGKPKQMIFPYQPHSNFGGSGESDAIKLNKEDSDLLQVADSGDIEAKNELLKIPKLAERERDSSSTTFGGWNSPDQWRAAESLMKLREKLKILATNRDKSSDGMVGDYAHWKRGRASDHNPWVKDTEGNGVVTGYDITNSPSTGCNVPKLVDSLVKSKDKRIKYIIWNRRIINSDTVGSSRPWTWRPYHGANPHDKHLHLSVLPYPNLFDSSKDWNVSIE